MTTIVNSRETRSQRSWQRPAVCHFVLPVVCWEPVDRLAFLWQGQLSSYHSNKHPDHMPWQEPWFIGKITHSRGCPSGISISTTWTGATGAFLRPPPRDLGHPTPHNQGTTIWTSISVVKSPPMICLKQLWLRGGLEDTALPLPLTYCMT